MGKILEFKYLPLAWGSLTAYWLGLGLQELGLSLVRLPDTFYIPLSDGLKSKIPQFVASSNVIHSLQTGVMLCSFVAAVSLLQKLCDDNKVGSVRFGTHAALQAIGTALTLYLMLSPELQSFSDYR